METDSEQGKVIAWSQPEILLYDDDTYIRMSYPDSIEEERGIALSLKPRKVKNFRACIK